MTETWKPGAWKKYAIVTAILFVFSCGLFVNDMNSTSSANTTFGDSAYAASQSDTGADNATAKKTPLILYR